jgi:hypothetical protein
MTETLGNLLRRSADAVDAPELDLDGLVAEAGRRQRRRRLGVVATAAVAVGAVAAVSVLGSRASVNTQQPPVAPAAPSGSSSGAVGPVGARPLVYAEGSTVHVGDKTVEAEDPVAFIDATDDGAVYEASLDGTLWFTDGETTAVIGTSGYSAAPTSHGGVVTTGDSGSLVVWADMSGGRNKEPDEFVVYDTSRRAAVARIPFPRRTDIGGVMHVDEDQVWFAPDIWPPDCWFRGTPRCQDPSLFRFDVASGETTKVRMSELDAELSRQSRMFVVRGTDAQRASFRVPGFSAGTSLRQTGGRLVTVTDGGDPVALTRTSGDEIRLRLPRGYTAPGLEWGGSVIRTAQWLDDDHVVVWANEGGGDLPPQHGDLLVCRLPDGVCHVEVPRTSRFYVAPN